MHNKFVFDPYPLAVAMQRLAENVKARRLEKKLSTKSLAEMSGVPASTKWRASFDHPALRVEALNLVGIVCQTGQGTGLFRRDHAFAGRTQIRYDGGTARNQ